MECLSKEEEAYQNCGASFIQHNAYVDDKAKEEVPYLLLLSRCQAVYNTGCNLRFLMEI